MQAYLLQEELFCCQNISLKNIVLKWRSLKLQNVEMVAQKTLCGFVSLPNTLSRKINISLPTILILNPLRFVLIMNNILKCLSQTFRTRKLNLLGLDVLKKEQDVVWHSWKRLFLLGLGPHWSLSIAPMQQILQKENCLFSFDSDKLLKTMSMLSILSRKDWWALQTKQKSQSSEIRKKLFFLRNQLTNKIS